MHWFNWLLNSSPCQCNQTSWKENGSEHIHWFTFVSIDACSRTFSLVQRVADQQPVHDLSCLRKGGKQMYMAFKGCWSATLVKMRLIIVTIWCSRLQSNSLGTWPGSKCFKENMSANIRTRSRNLSTANLSRSCVLWKWKLKQCWCY